VQYLEPQVPDLLMRLIALGVLGLFAVLNTFTLEGSGKFQGILVAFLLLILVFFVLSGLGTLSPESISTSFSASPGSLFATAGLVFISFGGITHIANMAEEVHNPGKTLVRGIILAFIVVEVLYVLCIGVLIGTLPAQDFAASALPLSSSAESLGQAGLGKIFGAALAFAGILAFLTTANAGLASSARIPFAMGRDGFLPRFLGHLSPKYRTPWPAVLFTALFMALALIFLDLEKLAKIASGFMLFQFMLEAFSLLVIRRLKSRNYKPTFKVPLFPVIPCLGLVLYGILLAFMGPLPLIAIGIFSAFSGAWYFLFARKRSKQQSALAKVLNQVAGPELLPEDDPLEEELLSILMEREAIQEDRVDACIRQAKVLDLDEKRELSRHECFEAVAELAAPDWHSTAQEILRRLEEREEESSTLLYPGVAIPHAIPHAILPGEHCFELILVRTRRGIRWNKAGELVYTAFILLGTKDERSFHLQVLAALAQMLQDPEFHSRWHAARDAQELRNVLLLSKRRRW